MEGTLAYLEKHFVPGRTLCERGRIDGRELTRLIDQGLVPAPSYVVSRGVLHSAAFGELGPCDAPDGDYFPASFAAWLQKASELAAIRSDLPLALRAKESFERELVKELSRWDRHEWRLADSFDDAGEAIAAGLSGRLASFWDAHATGVFGVCVARPDSMASIVEKELLQERLAALTGNGAGSEYTEQERDVLAPLIDRYERASMPFSPPEYPRSSRKRLVEDLRIALDTSSASG